MSEQPLRTGSSSTRPPDLPSGLDESRNSETDTISQNVESILAFYSHEEKKISRSQRALENFVVFVGRVFFLFCILVFVGLWILANVLPSEFGGVQFDEPPFFWLQGIVSLVALLTTTIVLIKQNRMSKFEDQRAHLNLQIILLTEQKTTKIIHLLEELRRDLPMVKDRHDPEAAKFQRPTDPHRVLATIDEKRETEAQLRNTEDSDEKL